jgi:hypothetical protein
VTLVKELARHGILQIGITAAATLLAAIIIAIVL